MYIVLALPAAAGQGSWPHRSAVASAFIASEIDGFRHDDDFLLGALLRCPSGKGRHHLCCQRPERAPEPLTKHARRCSNLRRRFGIRGSAGGPRALSAHPLRRQLGLWSRAALLGSFCACESAGGPEMTARTRLRPSTTQQIRWDARLRRPPTTHHLRRLAQLWLLAVSIIVSCALHGRSLRRTRPRA